MKNISVLFFAMLLLASSCKDAELDPLQIDKLKQGSMLALRGAAYDNLFVIGFPDNFNPQADPATENFEFDADFLSPDINSLQEVEVFARATETGTRVRVATKSGADFKAVTGSAYPRASFKIPLTGILSALGKSATDFSSTDAVVFTNDYIYIELDLTLKDGSKVPASAIVNSSLTESAIFYQAHHMLYLAD